MSPRLAVTLNAIGLYAISAVLLAAFAFQLSLDELPCPLCLLQRVGFVIVAVGPILTIRYGPRPSHYALSLLGAVAGAILAARQILLHIIPPDPGYGTAFLGYHYYTWCFIIFVIAIVLCALVLLFDGQFARVADRPPGAFEKARRLGRHRRDAPQLRQHPSRMRLHHLPGQSCALRAPLPAGLRRPPPRPGAVGLGPGFVPNPRHASDREDLRAFDARRALDAALDAGADMVGFVFFPPSPRFLSPERAAAPRGTRPRPRRNRRAQRRHGRCRPRGHRDRARPGLAAASRQGAARAGRGRQGTLRPERS